MKRALEIAAVIFIVATSALVHADERCVGIFAGDRPSTSEILRKSDLYGISPCMILLFYDARVAPAISELEAIGDAGALPVITIEPWNASSEELMIPNDEYVLSLAAAIKGFGKRVYIRYAHEMNGDWYPWAGDPPKYLKMYRDFHDRLTAALGDMKVLWIWAVNNRDIPQSQINKALNYYPGGDCVDLIGIDGYLENPSMLERAYIALSEKVLGRSLFSMLFKGQMEDLKGLKKPFIVAEIGIASNPDFKADAIRSFFKGIPNDISAIIWFDINKEADWRIASDIKSLESFRMSAKEWMSNEEAGTD